MSFVEHLGELRRRLIISVVTLVLASFACFGYAEPIAHFLMRPVSGLSFVYLSPSELFVTYTKIALFCGLVLSLPIIVYQLWAFVQPALARRERRILAGALTAGGGFFLGGAAFAFYMVLPMTIRFFLSYSLPDTQALFSIGNYFGFIFDISLSFGAAFELPVVCAVLGAMGILSARLLVKVRHWAILGILVAAAVLSPPDVVSMILLALPMLGLYELSIIVLRISGARREREARKAAPAQGLGQPTRR